MSNLRYGLKEVANVIFFDVSTNKPVLFFDTLKVSTIENTSESAEARGGQGNPKRISWDFGRTATLTMQDALLSDASLAMLAGTELKTTDITVVGREVLTVDTGKVTLANTPIGSSVTVFKVNNGVMGEEVTGATVSDLEVTVPVEVTDGSQVMVFYDYKGGTGTSKVTFSGSQFPATYRVVGDTLVRGEDGVDRIMQFVIPKAKLQSNFTLTMEAENVSTFDFTLDVLAEAGTNTLYDIVRLA